VIWHKISGSMSNPNSLIIIFNKSLRYYGMSSL
jgi:hypothetical protein